MRDARRHIRSVLTLIGLVAVLGGCSPSLDLYYPLQVGSRWTYRTEFPRTGEVETHVETITGLRDSVYTFDNGRRVVRLTNAISEETGVDLLRSPIKQGLFWRLGPAEVEITSVNRTVTVPAGTYERCVEVTWRSVVDGSPRETVTSYAPDVGPILIVYTDRPEDGPPELIMRSELTSYEPGETG